MRRRSITTAELAQRQQWLNPNQMLLHAPENAGRIPRNVRAVSRMPKSMSGQFSRQMDGIGGLGLKAGKKMMGSYFGGDLVIRTGLNVMSHDSSQGSFSDHMAKESFKMMPDILLDAAIFEGGRRAIPGVIGAGMRSKLGKKTGYGAMRLAAKSGAGKSIARGAIAIASKLGPMGKLAAGVGAAVLAGTSGMYESDYMPGNMIGKLMDNASEKYNEQKYGRGASITQNRRTMSAMQKSMNLLGQSRPQSLLGQEAQLMHN